MYWLRIPPFLWPLILKYYFKKVFGFSYTILESNWIYFIRLVARNYMILKRSGDSYSLINPITHHQFLIRPDSSDILVYIEIFFHDEYKLIDQVAITPPVILDLGANVGFFMMYCRSKWPDARVICVEPDENNLAQLNRQIELNNFSNIKVVSGGIWTSSTNLSIVNKEGQMEWALQVKSDFHGEVQGFTLKQIILESEISKVDLLKIDIEGAEEELFKNDEFLSTLERYVENIIMETHDADQQIKIVNQLMRVGFDVTKQRELLLAKKSRAS